MNFSLPLYHHKLVRFTQVRLMGLIDITPYCTLSVNISLLTENNNSIPSDLSILFMFDLTVGSFDLYSNNIWQARRKARLVTRIFINNFNYPVILLRLKYFLWLLVLFLASSSLASNIHAALLDSCLKQVTWLKHASVFSYPVTLYKTWRFL